MPCCDTHYTSDSQPQCHPQHPNQARRAEPLPFDQGNASLLSHGSRELCTDPHASPVSEHDSTYGSYSTPVEPSKRFEDDLDEPLQVVEASDEPRQAQPLPGKDKPVSWSSLPRKDQLFVLTLARLAEPLVQTSLSAYIFFMLKSFDPSLSDSTISSQAGWLTGSFTAAQCLTAVIWGRLADKEWIGRKNVLITGLLGTFVSTLGFGFSRSFYTAVCFRALGGALNGNVGVMRTVCANVFRMVGF